MKAVSGTNKDFNGQAIAKWYVEKTGIDFETTYSALGFLDEENRIKTAVIFFDYNGWNIEIAYFGRLTRDKIKFIANHVFGKLGCGRITVKFKRKDIKNSSGLTKIGFTLETELKNFFGSSSDDDAIVFCMLLDDLVPEWVYNNVRSA